MNCRIVTAEGKVKDIEREPVCGDYCEQCGDCLVCHSEDLCRDGDEHSWFIDERR